MHIERYELYATWGLLIINFTLLMFSLTIQISLIMEWCSGMINNEYNWPFVKTTTNIKENRLYFYQLSHRKYRGIQLLDIYLYIAIRVSLIVYEKI